MLYLLTAIAAMTLIMLTLKFFSVKGIYTPQAIMANYGCALVIALASSHGAIATATASKILHTLVVSGPDNRSALFRVDEYHGSIDPPHRRVTHHHGIAHICHITNHMGCRFSRQQHHRLGNRRHTAGAACIHAHHLPSRG